MQSRHVCPRLNVLTLPMCLLKSPGGGKITEKKKKEIGAIFRWRTLFLNTHINSQIAIIHSLLFLLPETTE